MLFHTKTLQIAHSFWPRVESVVEHEEHEQ